MKKPVTGGNAASKSRKDVRSERLSAELRANLKRRKAAARDREGPLDTGSGAAETEKQ